MINKLAQHFQHFPPPQTRKFSMNCPPPASMEQWFIFSEESRQAAAEARARWNAGEMSEEERQAFANKKHGGIFDPENKMTEREMIATQGTHNLLGSFEFVAGNGQPFVARIGVDGIWISFDGWVRDSFQKIDPSSGVPGLDQPTVRKLDFIHQIVMELREIMPPEDNNLYSLQGIAGNHGGLKALIASFEAVRENVTGQGHMRPLEDAFRLLLTNFFDESARQSNFLPEGSSPSKAQLQQWFEQTERMRKEARGQANVFADAFLNNLNRIGAEGAFDIAWTIVNNYKTP